MEKLEAKLKQFYRRRAGRGSMPHCQRTLITAIPGAVPVMTMVPVPWSLAWCEDGELAPQDRFDLLQSLVRSESHEVQMGLIASVERLATSELSLVITSEVTGLCA